MLKQEVEGRGLRWIEGDDLKEGILEPGEQPVLNGTNGQAHTSNGTAGRAAPASATNAPSGRLTDEQLRRLLAERMGEPEGRDDEEEGVHL